MARVVKPPSALNEDEHALLRAEASRGKAAAKWDAKIKVMRVAITKTCRHTQTTEFKWEHDNGYGRQSQHVGLRCVFCLKVNRWPKVGPDRWEQEYYEDSDG
jgi:hypothetical protein